jgi:hypothetical protein
MDLVRFAAREHGSGMVTLRTFLLAIMLVVAPSARADGPDRAGAHGFDFLFGEWRVHHRLKRANGEWWEFDGTASNRGLMAGASNVEEHIFTKPSGTTYGVALRAYDADQDHWTIWWLDSRAMSGPLQAPNVGRFENGVGQFYSEFTDSGKAIRSRLKWSDITATSARWEQAYSYDGGKTWDTNWIMTFARR